MKAMAMRRCWMTVALLLLASPARVAETRAADVVKELTERMSERQLEAIAAQDPAAPSRFVAALLVPGVQLLVVTADYPNPAELQGLIGQRSYRDVYSALHQPSASKTRTFFIDAGCDGLTLRGEAVDVMYERGTSEMLFDGNWKKSGLSESAYEKKTQDADAEYDRLVGVLLQHHGSLP